jgi:5-methylcytosine-specific restriction endonuclease McrBC regulatory subunit McrC
MDDAKDKHTTVLKQNDAILDKFHDDLKESADKENKVKINDLKSPSFYLPPISKVSSVLGFITNQKQFIDIFEATYDTPLNISRTSKYAFFKQGVGLRTANKIEHVS